MATGTETLVIGDGTHRYEVIDLWGKLPAGLQFGTTHGVVEDGQGRIYIHNTGEKSVIVFDADGNYLSSWGEAYSAGAHGMLYNREDNGEYLYLAATGQNFMAKVTLDGREVLRIGTPPRPDIYDAEKKFVPTEAAVASDGTIFITDGYGQHWVHRYNAKGEYLDSFGGLGSEVGQLHQPHGIMIDTRNGEELVLVADRANHRMQYFTLAGKPVRMLDHDLRMPCTGIQWGDELYIPDLFSRISIFDRNDQLIEHLGDRPNCWETEGWPNLPREQWVAGKFSSPHDMHVDGRGNIYVAEWLSNGTGKVTKLIRQ
jgi:DNA-binding beta-propeller fold protein YncE